MRMNPSALSTLFLLVGAILSIGVSTGSIVNEEVGSSPPGGIATSHELNGDDQKSQQSHSQFSTALPGLHPDDGPENDDRTLLDIFGEKAKEYLTQNLVRERMNGWMQRSVRLYAAVCEEGQ